MFGKFATLQFSKLVKDIEGKYINLKVKKTYNFQLLKKVKLRKKLKQYISMRLHNIKKIIIKSTN